MKTYKGKISKNYKLARNRLFNCMGLFRWCKSWDKGVKKVENLILNLIMERVNEVRNMLEVIKLQYMYRELTNNVDKLFKEALSLHEGDLLTMELKEDGA
jgi:hypothetical protein